MPELLSARGAAETLDQIRLTTPLIHNITNYVAANFSANALLAIGASPAMIDSAEEVENFIVLAKSLIVNTGTLTNTQAHAITLATSVAHEQGIPWVLDPVGVGLLPLRSMLALRLLNTTPPTVIRGNASEIIALNNLASDIPLSSTAKGVDACISSEAALTAALHLNTLYGCIVSISGATDYIVSDTKTVCVRNGSPLMTKITAMGCTASAITAACLAVQDNWLAAAAQAMILMGIAGEQSALHAPSPGSMAYSFIDALYTLTPEQLYERTNIEVITHSRTTKEDD